MNIKINKQTNNIQDAKAAISGLIRMLENATIKDLQGNYIINVEIRKVEHFQYEDITK